MKLIINKQIYIHILYFYKEYIYIYIYINKETIEKGIFGKNYRRYINLMINQCIV
jgi:hypothetical protein